MANLIAKAEIAYTYSRMGLKCFYKAVQKFKEVIAEIEKVNLKENVVLSTSKGGNNDSEIGENNDSEFVAEYYCVWMYGCALPLRRLCHVNNMHDICDMEQITDNYKYVVELYSRILDLCADRSKCIQRYKARSYIELGVMAYDVRKKKLSFPRGMFSLFPESSPRMLQTREYFFKALEIFPNDVFVLERSGRYFRYISNFKLSIDLLTKAISIKETSFGHHHLALSFKRPLEIDPQGDLAHLFNSVTIDEQSTRYSGTGQNTKENEVESVASCNRESIIYKRSKTVTLLQGFSGKHSIRNTPADMRGHFEGKSLQTKHSAPQNNQTLAQNYDEFTTTSVNAKSTSEELSENRSCERSVTKYQQREMNYPRNKSGKSQSRNGGRKFQFDNASQFSQQEKYSTKSGRKLNYPGQEFYYRYQETRHVGLKKGLQSDSADYTSNYCRRGAAHSDKRKDKPANKCPRDPVPINYEENKEIVDKIFSHLDRAAELSTNTSASYDKAILYRQIKHSEKALDILEQLMQYPGDVNSPVMLANIYEQAAFCLSAILNETNSDDAEKIEQLKCDRDMYLKSSLEISCDVVAKIPHLHECWKSATTLKEILLDRSKNKRNKETLHDLYFLYDKLNSHFEAVGVLKELKDLVDDDEQHEIITDIVRKYMDLGNYEEAVIALRMTKQPQNSFPTKDQELYLRVHIEAGLDAFIRKHVEKARLRIRQAIEFQCGSDARLEEMTSGEDCFELFVLSNLDCDDAGRKLTTLLTELGVKTTLNIDSHSVVPGTPVLQGITEMMMKSEAFAILVDFDTKDKRMQHITDRMQNIKQTRKNDPLSVVLTAPGTEFPPGSIYSIYNTIHMDIDLLSDTESMLKDESMCKSIKELLLYVAKRHCASYGKEA